MPKEKTSSRPIDKIYKWLTNSGWEGPLENGNGNPLQYSRLGNPVTEEHSRLQSMESQRVRHD